MHIDTAPLHSLRLLSHSPICLLNGDIHDHDKHAQEVAKIDQSVEYVIGVEPVAIVIQHQAGNIQDTDHGRRKQDRVEADSAIDHDFRALYKSIVERKNTKKRLLVNEKLRTKHALQ